MNTTSTKIVLPFSMTEMPDVTSLVGMAIVRHRDTLAARRAERTTRHDTVSFVENLLVGQAHTRQVKARDEAAATLKVSFKPAFAAPVVRN